MTRIGVIFRQILLNDKVPGCNPKLVGIDLSAADIGNISEFLL